MAARRDRAAWEVPRPTTVVGKDDAGAGLGRWGSPLLPLQSSSLLSRLERAAELVGQRTEPFRRRRVLAFGVLTHFILLFGVQDRLYAEANAAASRVNLEHRDLEVSADGKRLRDIRFPGDAGFAQRDQAGAAWREVDEHAEL